MTGKVKDGRTTRWAEHREGRRSTLVEAAVSAIDEHGPDASIARIAKAAGVTKPVLYRYFDDKSELHAEVGRWYAQQILDRIVPELAAHGPVRTKVTRAVDGYLSLLSEHPQVFLLVVRHRSTDAVLADGKAAIAATFARVIGDGLRALEVDAGGAEPWAEGVVGLGLSVGEWWLSRGTMSRTAVRDYLSGFLFHAFAGITEEYGVDLEALGDAQAGDPTLVALRGERRSQR